MTVVRDQLFPQKPPGSSPFVKKCHQSVISIDLHTASLRAGGDYDRIDRLWLTDFLPVNRRASLKPQASVLEKSEAAFL